MKATLIPIQDLEDRIMHACDSTPVGPKRRKALDAIRWRMKSNDGFYAGLGEGMKCLLFEDMDKASIFTGCDNHTLKLAFWSRLVGEPLTIELL